MEEWRDVSGYSGIYEVSSLGRVRSVDRNVTRSDGIVQHRSGKIKAQQKDKDGYMTVSLSNGATSKRLRVHRLVAEAFLAEDISCFDVDHKDFTRTNNCVKNLSVITHKQNVGRTKCAGRHVTDRGVSGVNNPNYGNRTLSDRYSKDRALAKEKQSRPLEKNGMAKKITAFIDGKTFEFPCISLCARYMIDCGNTPSSNIEYISTKIRKAAMSGDTLYGASYALR